MLAGTLRAHDDEDVAGKNPKNIFPSPSGKSHAELYNIKDVRAVAAYFSFPDYTAHICRMLPGATAPPLSGADPSRRGCPCCMVNQGVHTRTNWSLLLSIFFFFLPHTFSQHVFPTLFSSQHFFPLLVCHTHFPTLFPPYFSPNPWGK